MVLLTVTDAIIEALNKVQRTSDSKNVTRGRAAGEAKEAVTSEPPLSEPSKGRPISHSQIIDISRQLKAQGHSPYHLDTLLRGTKIYIPPPPPKPEPTEEYKVLMSRLRREEEARVYERMISPPQADAFLPSASAAYAFSSTTAYESFNLSAAAEDGITYEDINRQMMLIFNVLLSIVACAAAIWVAARWWSTPARLAMSMSGSLLVGVAEVVVYSGYIRRLGEAKARAGKVKEVKEVVKTWVFGDNEGEDEKETGDNSVVAICSKGEASSIRERNHRKK